MRQASLLHPSYILRAPRTSRSHGSAPWTLLCTGLLVTFFIALAPAALHACSCMPPSSATDELTKADTVFVGLVVSVVTEEREVAEIRSFFSEHRVTFELQRVWKGLSEGETVTLTTAADSAACGYAFEEGETYLVYAYDAQRDAETDEGSDEECTFTTNLCTRNARVARAGDDLAALGEPVRTVAAPEEDPEDQ